MLGDNFSKITQKRLRVLILSPTSKVSKKDGLNFFNFGYGSGPFQAQVQDPTATHAEPISGMRVLIGVPMGLGRYPAPDQPSRPGSGPRHPGQFTGAALLLNFKLLLNLVLSIKFNNFLVFLSWQSILITFPVQLGYLDIHQSN